MELKTSIKLRIIEGKIIKYQVLVIKINPRIVKTTDKEGCLACNNNYRDFLVNFFCFKPFNELKKFVVNKLSHKKCTNPFNLHTVCNGPIFKMLPLVVYLCDLYPSFPHNFDLKIQSNSVITNTRGLS